MRAKELYDLVKDQQELQVKNLSTRIKNAKDPSAEITKCISFLVNEAYCKCVTEMEHDRVLEYSVDTSLKVVDYSLLRQMGAALAIVKRINKSNRSECNYGEPYYKMYLVGLSKVTVKVKIKRRFGIFNK